MQQNSKLQDDELDLSEMIAALWSHKIFIVLITGLFTVLSGFHALTTDKEYTAVAVFQIEEPNNSGFNIPTELGAIASLAGLGAGIQQSGSKILIERAYGREFILRVLEKFSLDLDPFFNFYDPNYKDPIWKATIKKLIGWQKPQLEKKAIIEHNVIENYREYINFQETDAGAISLAVTHEDPAKAADYANGFMIELKQLVEREGAAAKSRRLNYLSETLADALQEMDRAQKNLKDYALENSALAQTNFISGSLKLDEIRMEKRKVEEIANLLSILENLIKSGNLDIKSYEALRSTYPLVDDIDFRRILGMSETISAWDWPEIETIEAVRATLTDRINRLNVEINNIEEDAKIYATSAEDLAKFTRDAKIAEATYTVLIEQVKSQSLVAGFQPESFKVFEYASSPRGPSSPKRNLILALGTIFGGFLGCALSLLNSARRGVYYTTSALISDAKAELALKIKPIRRLSRKSISDINSFISKRRIQALDEAEIKLANKNIIYIFNLGGKSSSSDITRLLATQSAQSGRNVVLCDTTLKSKKEIEDKPLLDISGLPIVNIDSNINLLNNANGASFFTSTSFGKTLEKLITTYDQVYICSNTLNSNLGLMALKNFNTSFVLIAGLRTSRKLDIRKLESEKPIDLLFYD